MTTRTWNHLANPLLEDHEARLDKVIEKLPADWHDYDQKVGMLGIDEQACRKCPACVGAWLAYALDRPEVKHPNDQSGMLYYAYGVGQRALANHLNLDLADLSHLLSGCGAPLDPFGIAEWAEHPVLIFERLSLLAQDKAQLWLSQLITPPPEQEWNDPCNVIMHRRARAARDASPYNLQGPMGRHDVDPSSAQG